MNGTGVGTSTLIPASLPMPSSRRASRSCSGGGLLVPLKDTCAASIAEAA
jgi:hypothetical protein